MTKCGPVRFAKEKYQSCLRVITNFCDRFEFDFLLAFRWSNLKPIGYSVVKFFDEGIGFSWRAYRNLGTSFTCINSAMGLFVNTVGTLDWL